MSKKFVLVLGLLGLFMVSFASAADWDNILNYDESNEEIVVTNALNLGRDLIKAKLTDNFCEEGRFCEADKTITLYEESVLIEDFKTLRVDDGSWEEQDIRWHKFEYWGEIDDYETRSRSLGYSENGTEILEYYSEKVGSHEGWINFNEGDIFPAGTYQVRTTGEIKPGRVYDWQIKIAGEWTTPWAIWGEIGVGGATAEVILNSPADDSIAYVNLQTFNASANVTGGAYLTNMSLYTNETGSWALRNTTSIFNKNSNTQPNIGDTNNNVKVGNRIYTNNDIEKIIVEKVSGSGATRAYIYDDSGNYLANNTFSGDNATIEYNLVSGTYYRILVDADGASYNLKYSNAGVSYPKNNQDINFISYVYNINTLTTNEFASVQAIYSTTTTSTQTWNRIITDDIIWNVQACDSDGDCGFAPSNYSLSIDTIAPGISVSAPTGTLDYNYVGANETLNVTFTDTNIDTCWYDYNGTNVTIDGCVSGVANITNFTLEAGNTNMTIWANDSVGNINSEYRMWSYNIFQLNETFDISVVESSNEDFITWVTFNGTLWNSISAILNYNGTNYSTTQSSSGSNIMFQGTIDIPTIEPVEQNNTFYWIFTLTNSTETRNINSKESVQLVTEVSVDICDPGDKPYIIFDTRNAENPFPSINGTFKSAWTLSTVGATLQAGNFSYEDITETNSSWEFCISPNTSNYTVSVDVEVDASGFAKNFYYIQDADYISNTTTNISLYLLNDSFATATTLEVKDRYQVPITNALIFIQLYDVGTDLFYTVGMAKTDLNGKDTSYLNWFDSLYKFVITKDGETIYTEDPRKVYETPTRFNVEDSIVYDFDKFQDFEYTLFYNNVTQNFVLTYVKPSALVEEGCLRVTKRTAQNDTTICNTCSSSSSATLYCNIANYGNGTFIANFYATGSLSVIDWITEEIGVGMSEEIFELLDSSDSAFYSFLGAGITVAMFLINGVFGVIGLLLGLMAISSLGFAVIDYAIFLTISVVGGIVIWLIKN